MAIVVGGVALSVAGWWFAQKQARLADTERFARMTDRPMGNLKERLLELEVVLRSERALFDANDAHDPFDRTEWASFADGVLPLVQQYVAGFTYIERVPRERLPVFLADVKAKHEPDFTLQTSGNRPELYLIRYARSFNYSQLGIGLDVGTDQTRSEALERAMLTGRPALSKHTFLLLENTKRPACLMYIPIYSKGVVPATTEERRERLQGWVSARIRLDNIVYDWSDLSGGQLDYEIYDGRDVISPGTFVLANTKHLIASTLVPSIEPWLHDGRLVGFRHVDLMGRGTNGWTVCFIATPAFDAAGSHAFQYSILVGGLMVSLLSGWVFWSMGTTKSRAQELAEVMTKQFHQTNVELRKMQESAELEHVRLKAIFDSAPVALTWIIVGHPETRLVNNAHMRITGVGREAAQSDPAAYRKVTHPEDQAKQDELTARVERGEINVFSLEKRYVRPNGEIVWALLTARRFPDLRTGQIHEVTTIVDITEEKR
ncbi:MAG TPA: CHASE domain-containing protein, partial [Opitutaceae bacterium]|nr:CHASE domain-containing protein [Opitutaceae bacterium]